MTKVSVRMPVEVDVTYVNKIWASLKPRKNKHIEYYVIGFFQRHGKAIIKAIPNNNPETIENAVLESAAIGCILYCEENKLPNTLKEKYEIYELKNGQRVNGDVHITVPNVKTGSGFLVIYKKSPTLANFYLITNKHMIGSYSFTDPFIISDSIVVDFYKKTGGIKPVTIKLKNNVGNVDYHVNLHPNPLVDIVAINISNVFSDLDISRDSFDTTFLLRSSVMKEINIGLGSQVFTLGYPNNFMIYETNQPLAKTAYIASAISDSLHIKFPFQDRAGGIHQVSPEGSFFLVDGLIVNGNSGGPIINPNEVKMRFKDGEWQRTHEAIPNLVLGIVSAGVPGTGLTIIYSSENIIDLLNSIEN